MVLSTWKNVMKVVRNCWWISTGEIQLKDYNDKSDWWWWWLRWFAYFWFWTPSNIKLPSPAIQAGKGDDEGGLDSKEERRMDLILDRDRIPSCYNSSPRIMVDFEE